MITVESGHVHEVVRVVRLRSVSILVATDGVYRYWYLFLHTRTHGGSIGRAHIGVSVAGDDRPPPL